MSKDFLFKFLIAAGILGAVVTWMLAEFDVFQGFSLLWVIVILAGAWGAAFLLRGMFAKGNVVLKKWSIFAGSTFLVIAVIATIIAFTDIELTGQRVFAIVGTALAAAILLGVLFTGGKKWDQGDNKKVGYKNYYQRKEAEEKAKRDAEKED